MANQYLPRPLPELTKNAINRFWSKVAITANDNKCWEWNGSKLRRGYGGLSITVSPNKDLPFSAHRIAYFLEHNIDPLEKLVCHHCDNPGCVNPKHLFLGTELDNMVDMHQKGRGRILKGSAVVTSKITDKDIPDIFYMSKSGYSQIEISKKYNVVSSTISLILTKKRWVDVINLMESRGLI